MGRVGRLGVFGLLLAIGLGILDVRAVVFDTVSRDDPFTLLGFSIFLIGGVGMIWTLSDEQPND